ncbi:MAG TPA: Na+/H+ antiporter subunit E [Mycobacterium sp.]|nr:Na+/H+ antiporter subunit E [Mycobacterium sp.]
MRDEVTTAEWTRRVARLSLWAYLVWVVLTWTATVEDQVVGIIVAIMCGLAFAPLGPVVAPSAVLRPRRFAALAALFVSCLARIVRANLSLSRRILLPSRPLRSGMVITPTEA